MNITLKSKFSGRENTMDLPITEQQWHCWNTGMSSFEKCFPNLNQEQKHFIEYGATKEEYENAYGDEESISNLPKEAEGSDKK